LLKKQNITSIKSKVKKEKPRWAAQKAEKLILKHKNPSDDPFRAVKVSDTSLPPDSTFVGEVFNYNLRKNRFNSMDMRVEMTEGDLCHQGIEFKLEITFLSNAKVSLPLDINIIKEACNQFYIDIAKYEYEKFYKHQPELKEVSMRLLNIIETLPANAFIMRIGRFSHAESMTLEGLRQIAVMGKGRKFYRQEEGTTRNLALQKYPLGWVKVKFEQINHA
ncbi:MAG: hypothetical protein J7M03_03580, partial [Candidatus Desulfofervidaceae bacterium]|nr:hypothetical protein [Candidatus Desulfofervidaceae bacterium]